MAVARCRSHWRLAWVAACIGTVQLFFHFDWGHGIARAVLLGLLWVLTLGVTALGLGFERAEAQRWLDRLSVLLVALHVVIHLTVAAASIARLDDPDGETEMGAIHWRALLLMKQGVNPYAADALLDPVLYEALVKGLQANQCLETSGDDAMALFNRFWASGAVSDMRAAVPHFTGHGPACDVLRKRAGFIGFKYGPVMLLGYAPFVAVFGKAGIQLSHLVWLTVLCFAMARLATRWGAVGAFEVMVGLWVVLVPSLIRFDMLRHTDCDLAPTLLGVLAFWLLEERRPGLAGAVLALSLGAKVLPGVLLTPLLLFSPKRAVRAFIATLALVYVPALLADAQGLLSNVIGFNVARAADSTSLAYFLPASGQWALVAVFLAYGLWASRRLMEAGQSTPERLRFVLGLHLVFLLTAKVFHNNYVAWLLPWLGLWVAVGVRGRLSPADSREGLR